MQTITRLPEPSSNHATCAWCAAEYCTVIDLIDHVDDRHLTHKTRHRIHGIVGTNARRGGRHSGRDASDHRSLRGPGPAPTRRMGPALPETACDVDASMHGRPGR